MNAQIFDTIQQFSARPDKAVNGVSPEFAAMQIYKASSPIRVSPTRFYGICENAPQKKKP